MKSIILLMLLNLLLFGTKNVVNNADAPFGNNSGMAQVNYEVSKSSNNYDRHKLKAPLQNLFATTQWDLFLREFEMKFKFGFCGEGIDFAVGWEAHMIEPIGYMETTQKPLVFPFAKLDMGGNILKGNSLMETYEEAEGGRSVAGDSHMIYLPIMGIIFKKKLKFACFHKGDLMIPYMSEFDPTWKQDNFSSKLIPHMIVMFTPQGLLSNLFDCMAGEIVNAILGYQDGATINLNSASAESMSPEEVAGNSNHMGSVASASKEKMNEIRDTFYFVDGCNGFSPVGGYVDGQDVLTDGTLLFHGLMASLHAASAISPIPFLSKQSNIFMNTSAFPKASSGGVVPDTMCTWKDYPLPIASQYMLQLAYPTIGGAKELGVSGLEVSTAKNLPEGVNASVFVVWERRDYYAFAYFCGDEKPKDAK